MSDCSPTEPNREPCTRHMSSQSTTPTARRGQQTLYDAAASRLIQQFPKGIILRYESTEAFKAFLVGNIYVRYVVFNATDAMKLVRDHGSVHAVLEDWQIPIVTATDNDLDIYQRQRDSILDLLKSIQPAIYIPDAGSVYWDRGEQSQRNGMQVFINRLDWMMDVIEEEQWEVEVLPLAKGMYRWHYELLRDCYERHGFSDYAFYTKQYTGGNRGNAICKLESHIQNLIDVMDAENVFVLARHGETHLERLPPQVTGASGIVAFAKNCKADGRFSEEQFVDWRDELESILLDKPTVIQ